MPLTDSSTPSKESDLQMSYRMLHNNQDHTRREAEKLRQLLVDHAEGQGQQSLPGIGLGLAATAKAAKRATPGLSDGDEPSPLR
ncbi:hypothetical protein PG985_016324 [Apiospora marii]|uniref:uncharacterized protein n=1 Tax=Apiospora marii TaxID=335849 RepID=UPI00312E44DF